MKNFFKKKYKFIIMFLLGVIIASSITAYATSYFATDIAYKDGKSVANALDDLYRIKEEQISGEMKFINNKDNGFEIKQGQVELKSYGLTYKEFPTTNNNDWNYIIYEKDEEKNIGKNFEISTQLFYYSSSNENMGGLSISLLKNNQEKATIFIQDAWSAHNHIQVYSVIDNTQVYNGKFTTSYDLAGRYTLMGDGSTVSFYLGNLLLGSINYNNDLEYDKIQIKFSKYSTTFNVPTSYIESIYVGEPRYF